MSQDSIRDPSRRRFLRRTAAASMGGLFSGPVAAQFAAMADAQAGAVADYKAMVCVFLGGGDDSFNTFPPLDAASNAAYRTARSTIALSNGVVPLNAINAMPGGRRVGLHPQMAALAPIFDAGRVGIVGSIGTLIEPVSLASLNAGSVRVPENLFSHSQDATWMSVRSGNNLRGWGGRIGDFVQDLNGHPASTAISLSYVNNLLVGDLVSPFNVGADGGINSVATPGDPLDRVTAGAAQRVNLLERSVARVYDRLRDGAAAIQSSLAPMSQVPPLPPNPSSLTTQMVTVARLIAGRAASGARRQVFFVGTGGYDMHTDQLTSHVPLLQQLVQALVWFDSAMQQLGVGPNVTTFTASEFGRTFIQNGDGTDHAWGAHQIVMGGAVNGRRIFGYLPDLGPASPDMWGGNVLLPRVPVEQLAGSLGRWFGLTDAQLRLALPNLANFDNLVVPGPTPLVGT